MFPLLYFLIYFFIPFETHESLIGIEIKIEKYFLRKN